MNDDSIEIQTAISAYIVSRSDVTWSYLLQTLAQSVGKASYRSTIAKLHHSPLFLEQIDLVNTLFVALSDRRNCLIKALDDYQDSIEEATKVLLSLAHHTVRTECFRVLADKYCQTILTDGVIDPDHQHMYGPDFLADGDTTEGELVDSVGFHLTASSLSDSFEGSYTQYFFFSDNDPAGHDTNRDVSLMLDTIRMALPKKQYEMLHGLCTGDSIAFLSDQLGLNNKSALNLTYQLKDRLRKIQDDHDVVDALKAIYSASKCALECDKKHAA